MNKCLTRALSEDELIILILSASDYYKSCIILALSTGLRISDLLNLKKSYTLPMFTIIEQKTRKQINVYIPSWAIKSWFYLCDHSTDPIFLLSVRDKSSYRRYIKKLAVSLGINPIGVAWHSLRKSSATYIYNSSGIDKARQFLNHTNLNSTSHYVVKDYSLIDSMLPKLRSVIL